MPAVMLAVPTAAGDAAAKLVAFGRRQAPEQPKAQTATGSPRAKINNRKLRILPTSHTALA
ncbi:MAG: hypothetical protein C0483_11000 [Pirellula sp.]|nr:hypothetical protein [Pirellula sp.]